MDNISIMARRSASLAPKSVRTKLGNRPALRRLALPLIALIAIAGVIILRFSGASDGTFYPSSFQGINQSEIKTKTGGAAFWKATGSNDASRSSATVTTDWPALSALPAQTECVSFSVSSPSATISFTSSYSLYDANNHTTSPTSASATPYSKGLGSACVSVPPQPASANGHGARLVSTMWIQSGTVAVYKIFSKTAAPLPTNAAPLGVPGNWRLAFSDEFDGDSLDTGKWRPNWLASSDAAITKPVNSAEQSCYDPAQVSVGGGTLKLTAAARSCLASNGTTYPYASGLIESANHYTFTHGYLESRVYIPGGSTPPPNWPAFWANGTGSWPTTGELDVMELLDGELCYHFHNPSGGPGSCPTITNPSGWHTFGANWQSGSVSYYYDGKLVGTITQGITDAPMYLIANLGIATKSGTPPVIVPSTMQVDYIRVWQ